MSDSQGRLHELAARLAEGQEPDFGAEASDDPVVANLQRIARLASTLRRHMHGDDRPVTSGRWGHLELIEPAGEGSYGRVWRAHDPVLERKVAVKLRRSVTGADDDWAWINEARRLARVRHPNVLAVHGANIHDGRAGLWADWVEGSSLEAVIREHPPSRQRALSWARDLADALIAIHAAGVIHGDIKPDNVMLDPAGRVVLMDFGAGGNVDLEDAPAGVGSPLFMAPEQLAGEPATPASDCYMLGVTVYRLLTGGYPLTADSLEALRKRHREHGNLAPTRRGLPRDVYRLIRDLLDPEPGRRPDAATTRRRLDAILASPARRRRRFAVAAIIGALALGLGASLYALKRVDEERRASEQARAQEAAVSDFVRGILTSPNPVDDGSDVRVREVLERAVSEARERFSHQPEVLAGLLYTIGRSYESLDLNMEATEILTEARSLFGASAGRHAEELIDIEGQLLNARMSELEPAAAQVELEALAARAETELGTDHRVTVYLHINLADLMGKRGQWDAARDILRTLLPLRPRGDLRGLTQRTSIMHSLGIVEMQRDNITAARRYFEMVLDETEDIDNPAVINRVAARTQLATLMSREGDNESALRELESLIPEVRQHYGTQHTNYTAVMHNYGGLLRDLRRYEEAIPVMTEVIALHEASGKQDVIRTSMMRTNLANIMAETGRLGEAGRLRRMVRRDMVEYAGPDHPRTILTGVNLTEQLYLEGDPGAASLAAENLGHARERFGDEHPFTLEARELALRIHLREAGSGATPDDLAGFCREKSALLGERNGQSVSCRVHLAEAWAEAGRPDAARQVAASLRTDHLDWFGPEDGRTREMQALVESLE